MVISTIIDRAGANRLTLALKNVIALYLCIIIGIKKPDIRKKHQHLNNRT